MANEQSKKLTPEQQKAYTLIVKQAMQFLLQGDHLQSIVNSAEQGDPKESVVAAVMPLIQAIYAAAKGAGAKVEMATVLAASIEIVGNISEMLATVGIIQESEIPAFAGEVSKIAVTRHNEQAQKMQSGGQPQEAAPAQGGYLAQQPQGVA